MNNMVTLYHRKEDCCGCTACANICPGGAIVMQPDEEGFLYPRINADLCVDCGACLAVCPLQNPVQLRDRLAEPEVYALKHKSDNIRMTSASGGAFTALSDAVLNDNQPAAVYGAAFDKDNNFAVAHQRASTKEERDGFKGSKYVQSDLGRIFQAVRQDLSQDMTVYFTGTPCQAAGLYNYLTKIGRGRELTEKLILTDLVCHGVASPRLWQDHIRQIREKYQSQLLDYTFRNKEQGWRGYNVRATFANKACAVNTKEIKGFAGIYRSCLAMRPACYECRFANLNRPSDITIGDFWGIEKSHPELDDNKGVSLVIVNTAKGQSLFTQCKDSIDYWPGNTQDCLQPNLQRSTARPAGRQLFWTRYQAKGFAHVARRISPVTIKGLMGRARRALRRFFGKKQ